MSRINYLRQSLSSYNGLDDDQNLTYNMPCTIVIYISKFQDILRTNAIFWFIYQIDVVPDINLYEAKNKLI